MMNPELDFAFLTKEALTKEREAIDAKVRALQRQAEKIKADLEYWQRQSDAISIVQARYIFNPVDTKNPKA